MRQLPFRNALSPAMILIALVVTLMNSPDTTLEFVVRYVLLCICTYFYTTFVIAYTIKEIEDKPKEES
jgi:hypothetical protein